MRPATSSGMPGDALRHVVCLLAGAELDHPRGSETARGKGILSGDRLYLLATVTRRENDPAVAWDLAPRDQEVARGVVLLEKAHVRLHLGVDRGQRRDVGQF